MVSTYVNDLRLNELATGDGSGTWGDTTNTNLELIGEALSFGTEAITTNADTHTSTVADGATDPARSMYIKYTGTLDSACTITIAPNTLSRLHFIENGTSGSQNIIIKQGSGATVTIGPGDVKAVYLDGAGSGAAVVDAFASLSVVDLKVGDDLTVSDDLLLNSDDAVISFGADADVKITHDPDDGLFFKSTATGDDNPFVLTIQTGETDIAASDKLGVINFQAPDEGTGTDAILVAAGIEAVSEGDFSASSNATSLVFKTGASEAAAEKVRITSAGLVGIAATSPSSRLSLGDSTVSSNNTITFGKRVTSAQSNLPLIGHDSSDGTASDLGICATSSAGSINFYTGNNAAGFGTGDNDLRMVIDSSGAVGIGTAPDGGTALDVRNDGVIQIVNTDTVQLLASNGGSTLKNVSNNPLIFGTNNTEAMRIDSSGRLLIGTTASVSGHQLRVRNASGTCILGVVAATNFNSTIAFGDPANSAIGKVEYAHNGDEMRFFTNGGERMTISSGGNVAITGALSKGSGSFKIDHPLESKKDTHHLVHSFIEGPQADLIYRGKVVLSSGTATVNIDTAAGMTSGTFEALCADVQCFTSNETGWTAIKGSVSGATLTIQAQDNSCTDTISWLVVGERKDPHMFATEWTDDNGKVIVEPEKSE